MTAASSPQERIRENMRQFVNHERDLADETAARYDCDDILHPYDGPQKFRDYNDFVDRVARPLVEADGDDAAEQAAMKLYRTASPYSICVMMVMLQNRIEKP